MAINTGETSTAAIGRRVRWLREAMGLTNADFARLCGLTPQTITNYETAISRPNIDNMFAIHAATGATFEYVYRGVELLMPADLRDKIVAIRRAEEKIAREEEKQRA